MVCLIADLGQVANVILQRIGAFFSKAIRSAVACLMQAAQYVGRAITTFLVGVLEDILDNIPGVTSPDAARIAAEIRVQLESWNSIFPIYEALTCMTVIFGFRVAMGAWRAFMTMIWNAGNMHNAMPKIGGTG